MKVEEFIAEWQNDGPTLVVHTSGSTGEPKALMVEKRRMEASARTTCRFLGLNPGDRALLCLPLDFIAGKMMVVRALTCGLQLMSVEPDGHPLAHDITADFAAMVPLQVWNSLQVPEERRRLAAIRQVIIGGGAIDDGLASELKHFPNAIWSTYGMTETLSHIALRRLSGADASDWYTPFEGVGLSLSEDGCLVIDAPAVCNSRLVTNDLAEISASGTFRILGRKDNVVCSGGIKIQMEEVERRLQPYLDSPFCITKCKDGKLGEAVVLLTEAADTTPLEVICQQVLPRLWKPRRYFSIGKIPLTATGKIARKEAEMTASQLHSWADQR